MSQNCLFCKFVEESLDCYKVWEDEKHMAFLTPFPNTPGFTVVITKEHHPSYGFDVADDVLSDLLKAAKSVAKKIDRNLKVKRTGLMMEGFGVDHLHMKLFPMHGIEQADWKPLLSKEKTFYDTYPGMLASNDGPKMDDAELERIAALIRES